MFLTNLGILAGVYLSTRMLQRILSKTNRRSTTDETSVDNPSDDTQIPIPKKQKTTPEVNTNTEIEPKHALSYAKFSAASAGIATLSYFYPALKVFNIVLVSYSSVPLISSSLNSLQKEKKIKNQSYSAITTILLVTCGAALAAALSNVAFYFSAHLIARTRKESESATYEMFQQTPRYVWCLTDSQGEQRIQLKKVKVGDVIIVSTGEVIPVDGIIYDGLALIDQQVLTGETNLVERQVGDTVMASTVVLSGKIQIQASHSGEETRIDKLNTLLQETKSYKTQLQLKGEAWADRAAPIMIVSSILLVPVVGTLSAAALLLSVPINTIRSMLSTQTYTHLQGIADQGIFIKDGRALEELPHIDTVLFDKTGTLTETVPEVATVITTSSDYDKHTLLAFAAAAEQRLEHPVAHAIVEKAKTLHLDLPEIEHSHYDLGLGVTVRINGQEVKIGSQRFIQNAHPKQKLPESIATAMQAASGHTFILISIDGVIQGALELHPRLRAEAPILIKTLRQQGYQHLAIVSGDQQATTERLAQKLGIDLAYGDVLPQDKATLIAELQAQGRRVCFVGDGMNDAIAMKQANVSVSFNHASTITAEMAQVILMNDDLMQLNEAFERAKYLQKQLGHNLNFWIGFGASNALAVPLLGFTPLQSTVLYASAYTIGLWRNSNEELVTSFSSRSVENIEHAKQVNSENYQPSQSRVL